MPPDAGHGDRHARLGHRVHRAGQQRDGQPDAAGQPGAGVDLGRDDVRRARDQQDVVVGEPERGELRRQLGHGVGLHVRRPPFGRSGRTPVGTLAGRRKTAPIVGGGSGRLGAPPVGTTTVEAVTPFDDASGPDFGPADPAGPPPLTMEERAGVLDDLAELEVFRTLLEPTGIKGIVVDCPDCDEEHHVDWALMQANLRQLLEEGQTGRHEPPFDPDPDDYVSWDYASGYADGVAAHAEQDEPQRPARQRQRPPRPRGLMPDTRRLRGPSGTRPDRALSACRISVCWPRQLMMPRRKPVATASARSFAPSLRNSRRAWVLMVSSDR